MPKLLTVPQVLMGLFLAFLIGAPLQGGKYEITAGVFLSKPCILPLQEEEEGFIATFEEAYQEIPLEVLQIPDSSKVAFLRRSFQEEKDDMGKVGFYPVRLERPSGNFVGYISIDDVDHVRTLDEAAYPGLPEKSLYIRQLYVCPDAQHKGLGTLLVNEVINEYVPHKEHWYVATRSFNEAAIKLYEKCGFQISQQVLHGLSSKKYTSFEKHFATD